MSNREHWGSKWYLCPSPRNFSLDLFGPQERLERGDIFATAKGIKAKVLLGSCHRVDFLGRSYNDDLAVLSCDLENDQLA